MTNEQHEPTTEPVTFARPQTHAARENRRTRAARAAAWVGVGAIGATVLTGVAFAASGEESGSTPPAAPSAEGVPAPPGEGGGPGHGGPGHGMVGGLRDVLHGEYVVDADGSEGSKTRTMLGQQGEVTAISATSMTVRSSDGFTATWSLSDSTVVRGFGLAKDGGTASVADVEQGADVFVTGTKSGDTSGAATTIGIKPTDEQLAQLRDNAPQRRYGGPGRPDQDGSAPTPSSGATAPTGA